MAKQAREHLPEDIVDLEWIDRQADQFEVDWKSQVQPPVLAQYVGHAEGSIRRTLLQELIRIDLAYRQKKNLAIDLDSYAREFPETLEPQQTFPEELVHYYKEISAANGASLKPTVAVGELQTIGKYRILLRLGEGGQAIVYRAFHPDLGREVALKLSKMPVRNNPILREQLLAEARLLACVQHPGLVQIHDCDFHGDYPYLVLEYVSGISLAERAKQPLPPKEAARLMAQVARAVAAIHERNIIHQDLKPSNIVIDAQGMPRLIDFGLARLRNHWTTEESQPIGGTPAFMSPEQAQGKSDQLGRACDVFALGAILYSLLTGKPPFADTTLDRTLARVRTVDFDRQALDHPSIPRRLTSVCLRAMAANPHDRYEDANTLADDLEKIYQPTARHPRLLAVAFLLAIGIGCWLLWPTPKLALPPLRQPLIQLVERGQAETVQLVTPKTVEHLHALLPLRRGDKVVLRCDIPQGFKPAVFLRDIQGRWHDMGAAATEPLHGFDRLRVPATGSWEMDSAGSGTLLFLICASPAEAIRLDQVQELLEKESSGRWPSLPPATLLLMHRGEVEPVSDEIGRGPTATSFTKTWDRLAQWRTKLHDRCEHYWGIAVTQEEEPGQRNVNEKKRR